MFDYLYYSIFGYYPYYTRGSLHVDWINVLAVLVAGGVGAFAAIKAAEMTNKVQREIMEKQFSMIQKQWLNNTYIERKNTVTLGFVDNFNKLKIQIENFYNYLSPTVTYNMFTKQHNIIDFNNSIFIEPKKIIGELVIATEKFKGYMDSNEVYLPVNEPYYSDLKHYVNAVNKFFKYLYYGDEKELFYSMFSKQEDGSYRVTHNIELKRMFLDDVIWQIPLRKGDMDGILIHSEYNNLGYIPQENITNKEYIANNPVAFYGVIKAMQDFEEMLKKNINNLVHFHIVDTILEKDK